MFVVHVVFNQENVAVLKCFLNLFWALALAFAWITNFVNNHEVGCCERIVMPLYRKRFIYALESVFDVDHVAFGVRIKGVKAVIVPILSLFHRYVL